MAKKKMSRDEDLITKALDKYAKRIYKELGYNPDRAVKPVIIADIDAIEKRLSAQQEFLIHLRKSRDELDKRITDLEKRKKEFESIQENYEPDTRRYWWKLFSF